jgi:hypothetical protein
MNEDLAAENERLRKLVEQLTEQKERYKETIESLLRKEFGRITPEELERAKREGPTLQFYIDQLDAMKKHG